METCSRCKPTSSPRPRAIPKLESVDARSTVISASAQDDARAVLEIVRRVQNYFRPLVQSLDEAIVGREAIHDYWAGATGRQEDIHFTVGTCVHSGYMLAAEWTCTYQDRSSGDKKELAGMFLADFYGKQVRRFREYWLSRRR